MSEFRTSADLVNGWHRVIIDRVPRIHGTVNCWMLKDTDLETVRRKAAEFLEKLKGRSAHA